MKRPITFVYLVLLASFGAFFTASCGKSQTDTSPVITQGTTVVTYPDATKLNGYVLKKGSITINYADSVVTFTAPADSIAYTYGPTGNYYASILAVNAQRTSSLQIAMSQRPISGLLNSAFSYLQLSVNNKARTNLRNYSHTSDITQNGAFNVNTFNLDDVLLNGSFSILLTRSCPSCQTTSRVSSIGTINLSLAQ